MKFRRLNMDGSFWFTSRGTGILVDPWLHGHEIDYASWFNTQWHATPPMEYQEVPDWRAVLITQKYPDHFHKETLLRLMPTRVYASRRVAAAVQKLLPDATVHELAEGSPQRLDHMTLTFLPTRRRVDPFYDAVYLDDGESGVLIAPHGLDIDARHQTQLATRPSCKLVLAPYNRYKLPALLGGLVSPGLSGIQHLIEVLSPTAICRCHDELKESYGLIGRLAQITEVTEEHIRDIPWLVHRHVELPDYRETPV